MRKIVAGILCLVAFVIYVPSQQELPGKEPECVHIGWVKSNGHKLLARNKKIRLKNTNVEIWIKEVSMVVDTESKEIIINGKKLQGTVECKTCPYELTLYESNCDNRKIRINSVVKYSGTGEVLRSDDKEGEWISPVPDSIAEKIVDVACEYKE